MWLLLSTAQLVLHCFLMCSCMPNTLLEPWFWYDRVIPHDGWRSKAQFSACLMFQCHIFAGELCFDLLLPGWPTTETMICLRWRFAAEEHLSVSCIDIIQTQMLPSVTIALSLTFDPHWGLQSWGWETRWCVSVPPGGSSSPTHTSSHTATVWRTLHFVIKGKKKPLVFF